MITVQKLDIYLKYNQDSDHFCRLASDKEKELLTEQDWMLIDNTILDLHLLENGSGTCKMRATLLENARKIFESDEVYDRIVELVKE